MITKAKDFLLASAMVFFVGIFIILSFAGCDNKKPVTNIPVEPNENSMQTNLGNMYNGGQFIQGNNGIFFSIPPTGNEGFYWVSIDNLNAVTQVSNKAKRSLAVVGEKIYYTDAYDTPFGGGNQSLYYADFELKNSVKLVDDACVEALIDGNTLYFTTSDRLGEINLNGGNEKTLLNKAVSNICAYDGFLYYYYIDPEGSSYEVYENGFYQVAYKERGIYRINLADPNFVEEPVLVFKDDTSIGRFYIIGDMIYYLAGKGNLYRYDIKNHETTTIVDASVENVYYIFDEAFNVHGNELIYGELTLYGKKVCAYDISTEKTRVIMNDSPDFLYIACGGIIIPDGDKWKYININDPSITQTLG